MGIKRRIGLREIAGLEAGTTVWDTDVAGFGARRQKSSSVSYIVFYRTAEGRQRVSRWAGMARPGPGDSPKRGEARLGFGRGLQKTPGLRAEAPAAFKFANRGKNIAHSAGSTANPSYNRRMNS
jgi:hypothetical protein